MCAFCVDWLHVLWSDSWCPFYCWGKDSWFLYFSCVVAVCVLCPFLTVPWVGMQSVFVAFPGHIHLLSDASLWDKISCTLDKDN